MVRIVSDTSTLYSSDQAREAGFSVAPLSVTIAGKSYREFDEISSEDFVSIIQQGHMPTSSQPAIGEVAAIYDQFPEDEIVNISMAHGLSGTYTSAVAAAQLAGEERNITVINSRTLCGPHRFLVEHAAQLAKLGKSAAEIIEKMEELMKTGKSFLIPADFAYLRRGGRLSPLVSYVGQAIRLAPVLTQTENGEQLIMSGVCRGFVQAIQHVAKSLTNWGVGENWRIYITHADARHLADQAHELLKKHFPAAVFEIHPLSPAFITQGGPGCVAVQVIRDAKTDG